MSLALARPVVPAAPKAGLRDASVLPIVFVGHVDHGKSTLVGRILYDTNALPESRLAELRAVSAKRGLENEWSFLLDALQIERDQGITLDTTQVWFRTAIRTYRAIDAPGHAEFVKNMATGASAADAAILVVDAKLGVGEQTRRHAAVLELLGLRQVVVAVNKMDLVGFSQARFSEIVAEVEALFARLGFSPAAIVPLSARAGDNVLKASAQTPWYKGPTLLDALDRFAPSRPLAEGKLRMPVQDVYRRGDSRYVAGRIESGTLRVGDGIRIVPGGRLARVAAFLDWNAKQPRTQAVAGESVAFTLDTEAFVERGACLTEPDHTLDMCSRLRLRLLWLASEPLVPGRKLRIAIGTAVRDGVLERFVRVLERGLGTDDSSDQLARNGVASVELRLAVPIAADRFAEFPATGRGIALDGNRVVGGFVVEQAAGDPSAPAIFPVAAPVDAAARARANGHRGGVFWLTGLSGAGKSTVATAALRGLFAAGRQVQILDGDTLRSGLNADLGFSPNDRDENVRRTAHIARILAETGILTIVALISPLASHRALAREIVGADFHEIHVHADLETCRGRDPKGLYARAQRGEIASFTGVSAPYEAPNSPDLAIDTQALTPEAAAAALVAFIESRTAVLS